MGAGRSILKQATNPLRGAARLAFVAWMVVCGVVALPHTAVAVPTGTTLDQLDLVITLPPKPTDPATLRFTLTYSDVPFPATQRVDVSPDRVTHSTATPVEYMAVAHEDWTERWINVSLPPTRDGAPLVVPLEWTEPLMKHLHPKFWWDQVDAMIAFPFTDHLKPVKKGVRVVVVGPLTALAQPGWSCTKDATNLRCERFFPATHTNSLRDSSNKGLRIVLAKLSPETDYGLVGAQIGLWLFMFPLVAYARVKNKPLEQPGQLTWLIVRFFLGAGGFAASMAGWAYALDGAESDPMVRNMSIAAAVTALPTMAFALGPRSISPVRAFLGWSLLVIATFIGPVLTLATGEALPAFIVTGVLALVAPVVMVAATKES